MRETTEVISGVGLCTINFGNPRTKDFGDLPFVALKEAVQIPAFKIKDR